MLKRPTQKLYFIKKKRGDQQATIGEMDLPEAEVGKRSGLFSQETVLEPPSSQKLVKIKRRIREDIPMYTPAEEAYRQKLLSRVASAQETPQQMEARQRAIREAPAMAEAARVAEATRQADKITARDALLAAVQNLPSGAQAEAQRVLLEQIANNPAIAPVTTPILAPVAISGAPVVATGRSSSASSSASTSFGSAPSAMSAPSRSSTPPVPKAPPTPKAPSPSAFKAPTPPVKSRSPTPVPSDVKQLSAELDKIADLSLPPKQTKDKIYEWASQSGVDLGNVNKLLKTYGYEELTQAERDQIVRDTSVASPSASSSASASAPASASARAVTPELDEIKTLEDLKVKLKNISDDDIPKTKVTKSGKTLPLTENQKNAAKIELARQYAATSALNMKEANDALLSVGVKTLQKNTRDEFRKKAEDKAKSKGAVSASGLFGKKSKKKELKGGGFGDLISGATKAYNVGKKVYDVVEPVVKKVLETEAGKKVLGHGKRALFGRGLDFSDMHHKIGTPVPLTSGLNNPSVLKKIEELAEEKPKIVSAHKMWKKKY